MGATVFTTTGAGSLPGLAPLFFPEASKVIAETSRQRCNFAIRENVSRSAQT
jgi:hypothetical protein